MPVDDGLRLEKMRGFSPIRPRSRHDRSKQPIRISQPWSRVVLFQNGQLLAQDQILSGKHSMGV